MYEEVKGYAVPIVLHYVPCQLDELVGKTWDKSCSFRRDQNFSLQLQAKTLECEIDAEAIGRVLEEIFDNSLAAAAKSAEVEVVCRNDGLDGLPAVTLIISDNGSGVPAAEWEHAFRPFYTTKTHGTGLGLAVSRRIVAAHYGRIEFGHRGFRAPQLI